VSPHPARFLGDDRGQSLVEFTIVLPILVAIATLLVQGGLALNHYLTLTDAVRAGARAAAVAAPTGDPVAAGTSAFAKAAADLSASQRTVTVQPANGDVTVTGSYHEQMSFFGFSLDRWLTSTTTERAE
jgi:Flp pilus assembly protein TadG